MNSFMESEDGKSDKTAAKTLMVNSTSSSGTSLTEPVSETIMRDLNVVVSKLKFFFMQQNHDELKMNHEIQNYDLWGPFVFALLFAFCVTINCKESMERIFSTIIIYITLGSVVVTVNAKLLKTKLTLLQGGSLIGYSLFPMNISAVFSGVLRFMPSFLKVLVTIVAVLCSIKCGFEIIKCVSHKEKIYLMTYPLVLFYLGLGCFLFSI